MSRTAFQNALEDLQDELLVLASMTSKALRESVQLLKKQDLIGAQRLIEHDRVINAKRYEIESNALSLISRQQPVARDMRLIAAVIEICGELERIADYAKGIGRIIQYIGSEPLVKPLVDIPIMCDLTIDMLRDALDAFIRRDVDAARAIARQDDAVDALYNKVFRELVAVMTADSSAIDRANYLLWAAHNLERAADRVINICERVIFTVTGEFVQLDEEVGEAAIGD